MEKCVITGEAAATSARIFRRSFYFLIVKRKTVEISLSEKGKLLFYKNYSLGWQLFDYLNNGFRKIPRMGRPLLYVISFSIIFIYGMPLTILLDRISRTKILGRGGIKLGKNHKLINNVLDINDNDTTYLNKRKNIYIGYIIILSIGIILVMYFS